LSRQHRPRREHSHLARPDAEPTEHDSTILTAAEVHAYYRLGRTAGYQPIKRLDAERTAAALHTLLADDDHAAQPADEPVPALPAARRGGRRTQEV
jgi:hypothetical protein